MGCNLARLGSGQKRLGINRIAGRGVMPIAKVPAVHELSICFVGGDGSNRSMQARIEEKRRGLGVLRHIMWLYLHLGQVQIT